MTTTQDDDTGTASETGGRGRLTAVSDGAAEAYRATRERTGAAYAAARERAGSAYESARGRTADGLEANPMAAVFGGLALGAVVAALLPSTRREEDLLGPVGRRITDTAREAARAAREAGREQIDELGLSRDGVRRRLDEFTDRAVGAVKGAAAGPSETRPGK